jgi:hypothetical protein
MWRQMIWERQAPAWQTRQRRVSTSRHLTKNKQSPTGLDDPILFLMKQEDAQLDANWGGSPSPIHHWMEALLRLAAMCLLNLASLLGMRPSRLSGECHTDVSRRSRKAKAGATPQALPLEDRDSTTKEINSAATRSSKTTTARRESSLAKAQSAACQGSRLSKHRDCLVLPPLIPANAGTQGRRQVLFRIAAAARRRNKPFVPPWVPAFAGMSGVRALV